MNTNAIELAEEELTAVVGGCHRSDNSCGGQNINVNTNIAVPVNVNAAPTTNVALFSHDLSQTGSANNLQNLVGQHIN
jgi:hypothetical protein